MKQRVLERNLKVSALGLGCMGFSHAYSTPTNRNEAAHLIRQAVDMGYTFLDTAEVQALDDALNSMEMSDVFGGSKIVKK